MQSGPIQEGLEKFRWDGKRKMKKQKKTIKTKNQKLGYTEKMTKILFLLTTLLNLLSVSADHYAVLVAGSHTYGNYRHHADVAHAYHVAIKGGIKKENIIVMMYDDVVNDDQNPFPGQLFNAPTKKGTPGVRF